MLYTGFSEGPKLAAIVRALHLRNVYITSNRSVQIPFNLHSSNGMAEDQALIDSKATENFINHQFTTKHHLGTRKLDRPLHIWNVDGTKNSAGEITKYCDLWFRTGQQEHRVRFLVTNLGTDWIILGYPWLAQFNPDIDWPNTCVQGPKTQVYTLKHQAPLLQKTTIAQQMAEATHNPSKVNTKATIPNKYKQHAFIFSEKEAKHFPPERPGYDHQIKLKPLAPDTINCKIYPASRDSKEAQNEYINENLARKFIKESDLKYGFPSFTIAKKDGKKWFVIDYRKLNEHTEIDVTPLPCISSIIEEMSDKALFSKFDVWEGYHNIQIIPEDWWKTTFKTTRGLFEYNVMSFRLCNALGTFSRFIAHVVAPLYKKYPGQFRHYMNDILIAIKEGEDDLYKQICHELFELFKKESLFLKLSKCKFKKDEVDFLGVCLGYGVAMVDPSKLEGITNWPWTLKNVKEVWSTLGVLGFQRPFIPGFTKIACPLTNLLKKETEFTWTFEGTKSLDTLRPYTATKFLLKTFTRNSNTWSRGFREVTGVTGGDRRDLNNRISFSAFASVQRDVLLVSI